MTQASDKIIQGLELLIDGLLQDTEKMIETPPQPKGPKLERVFSGRFKELDHYFKEADKFGITKDKREAFSTRYAHLRTGYEALK